MTRGPKTESRAEADKVGAIVGSKLHGAFKRSGMTLRALTEATGLTLPTLYRVFRGSGLTSLWSVHAVAKALGLTVQLGVRPGVSRRAD